MVTTGAISCAISCAINCVTIVEHAIFFFMNIIVERALNPPYIAIGCSRFLIIIVRVYLWTQEGNSLSSTETE